MPLHVGKGRTVGKAIKGIIDYVENPQKTDNGNLISSFQCDSRIADAEFLFSKRQYLSKTGRQRGEDDVIAYTIRQSLLDYADLVKKADGASTRYNDLSEKIKAAEKRMAEIAVMKTHIINYSKTRDVYVAYRKAGYSKKFKAEHESEILLHQAAKKFFDESGLKKLPTVKGLQTEYVALLAEKKSAYADYRKARDEMKELLTVKANVDRLMGYDKSVADIETNRQEER